MNEKLLATLAHVDVPQTAPALSSIEGRARAIRRGRHGRRFTVIGAGAAVLFAGGIFWPTTTTPHGTVAMGGPLAFGAAPAAASQDASCSVGFGSWVSRDHWASSPEIAASASLITDTSLPLASVGVHQDDMNCAPIMPAAVFYATDPVRGISVWADVADPFVGLTDLTAQTVRGAAGQVRTYEDHSLQMSWVDPDGIRWLALGSAVAQADMVAILDSLVFSGPDGQTLDPASAPAGFVNDPVDPGPQSTTTRSWQVNYGDETFVEGSVPGKFLGLRATTTPSEPITVKASMYAIGTTFTEVNGELAMFVKNGPADAVSGWLLWERDGVTYRLISDGTMTEAVALADSVVTVPVTDPRVVNAPEYPLD